MVLFLIILWWTKSPVKFSLTQCVQSICVLTMLVMTVVPMTILQTAFAGEFAMKPVAGSADAIQKDAIQIPVIREGTVIPPTPGRIIMLGRRWGFIPDESTQLHKQRSITGPTAHRAPLDIELVTAKPETIHGSTQAGVILLNRHSTLRLASAPITLTDTRESTPHVAVNAITRQNILRFQQHQNAISVAAATHAVRMLKPATIVTSKNVASKLAGHTMSLVGNDSEYPTSSDPYFLRTSSSRSDQMDAKASDQKDTPVVLAENLMLQRIVDSIRDDAADDRWIISGVVTEFFGENRMVIKTAQRSNAE